MSYGSPTRSGPSHLNTEISESFLSTPCYANELVERIAREIYYRQWMDLNGLLALLWESHAVCTKVLYVGEVEKKLVTGLLPEVTERGIVELATYADLNYSLDVVADMKE